MDEQKRNFFRQLIHNAINAAIHSAMWKMPLGLLLIVIAILVAAVVYFQLY